MPLALVITTLVREYLQKDQGCMRQRRQAESAPQTHATPDSTTRQPPGQDRHDGAFSTPERSAHGGQEQPEQRKTDEITAQTTTPRMRTFLAECFARGAVSVPGTWTAQVVWTQVYQISPGGARPGTRGVSP